MQGVSNGNPVTPGTNKYCTPPNANVLRGACTLQKLRECYIILAPTGPGILDQEVIGMAYSELASLIWMTICMNMLRDNKIRTRILSIQ